MSIRIRLVVGLALLLGLMVGHALLSLRYVGQLRGISDEVATHVMARVEYISHFSTKIAEHRGYELAMILSADSDGEAIDRASLDKAWSDADLALRRYKDYVDNPEGLVNYDLLVQKQGEYADYRQRLIALSTGGAVAEAQALFASAQGTFDDMVSHARRLRQGDLETSLSLAAAARGAATRYWYLFVSTTAATAAVVLALGWYIWRSLSGGLSRLLAGTRRVALGDLSVPVPSRTRDEFGELALSFNAMVAALNRTQEENQKLTHDTLRMREEHVRLLRDSLVRVVSAQEKERQRISRELHDQAGQALMMLQLGLNQLEREENFPRMRERVASLRVLTLQTMEEVRDLAMDLRPAALDELGLAPALRGYVRDFSRRAGIPIALHASGIDGRMPAEVEVVLFRAIQEALTNAAKHSRAKGIRVEISRRGANLAVTVEDDGVGFDVAEVLGSPKRKALGLFGIRERVGLVGGSVDIESAPGKGTRMTIALAAEEGAQLVAGD